MTKGVSVVICCYNSASRLSQTLLFLAQQKTPRELPWEVILVDNASTDNTKDVAAMEWSKYNVPASFRIVPEKRPGLTYARETGINQALFDIVIFCDDDNWLAENYIETAHEKMIKNSSAGIIGGWCEGKFAIPPPKWLLPMKPALAINKPFHESGDIGKEDRTINGAGMVIRKSSYLKLREYGFSSILEDRKSQKLSSGGDTELCWAMRYAGYKLLFFQELFFWHYIPVDRMSKKYFFNLTLIQVSHVIILNMYATVSKRPILSFRYFLGLFLLTRLGQIFYFAPRILIGKYRFYCIINLLQNLKILGLIFLRLKPLYSQFKMIRSLRIQLSELD